MYSLSFCVHVSLMSFTYIVDARRFARVDCDVHIHAYNFKIIDAENLNVSGIRGVLIICFPIISSAFDALFEESE